jgi:hypothetical protein
VVKKVYVLNREDAEESFVLSEFWFKVVDDLLVVLSCKSFDVVKSFSLRSYVFDTKDNSLRVFKKRK